MKKSLFLIPWLALLAGCVSTQTSTTLPREVRATGIKLERTLPEDLPGKSSPFPHSQFVLLGTENALGIISPIPFVADLATNAVHDQRAKDFEQRYAAVHPYLTAVEIFRDSPLLARGAGGAVLRPFVFLQDCVDDRYRLAYVFDVTGAGWHGRYFYHLPSTLSRDEAAQPGPATLERLGRELTEGARILRALIERDARGALPETGRVIDVGSYNLVGGRAIGLISPEIVLARDGRLLEETPDHVLVRLTGDPTKTAATGGLFFGVHWFRPDQLHTLKRR